MEISAIDFLENLDFDENVYFYHITEKGVGEKIINNGLLMVDSHFWSTIIQITPDMLENPYDFLKNEKGNNIRGTEEMVIISCDKEDVKYLVKKNKSQNFDWNLEDDPEYIILKDNIVGYIDLTDLEYPLFLNPDYSFSYGR